MITVLYCIIESDKTGITSTDLSYIGMIYYEEKRVEDLVTFAASKNLNALLKVTLTIYCLWSHYYIVCQERTQ